MPLKKKAATAKGSSKLVAHNFLPTLTKLAEVVGDYIAMQGKDWTGCPSADKEKWYRCIVRQFEAMHDFGAFRSAAFEVQEMGESGEGSLEPGVASGEKFFVAYQQPFLKYYYAAHPDRLPDGHPDKPIVEIVVALTGTASPTGTAVLPAAEARLTPSGLPGVKQDAPIYGLFDMASDELCGTAGANYGKRQQVWECNIRLAGGDPCCAKRTLTFSKPTAVPPNSNLSSHVRDEAKKCAAHAVALEKLNEMSKHQVLVGGSYETVHSFEDAFPHHLDYVWMVATGEVSAVTGQKPMFRTYTRGVLSCVCMPASIMLADACSMPRRV
mgnify:CR=1 FL=1|jgi:hypothetical protein